MDYALCHDLESAVMSCFSAEQKSCEGTLWSAAALLCCAKQGRDNATTTVVDPVDFTSLRSPSPLHRPRQRGRAEVQILLTYC